MILKQERTSDHREGKMTYEGLSDVVDFDSLPDPNSRFELLEIIGEGTYGEIYAAKDHETGNTLAIKVMENVNDNLEEIEEEFLVLRDLSIHPNLPSFSGIFLKKGQRMEEDQIWLAMELCSRGSITDLVQGLMKRGKRLTEEQISYILKETIYGLSYLHNNHCMHRDIKGHNILLTNSGQVKLIDFGVSSHLESTWSRRNTSVGTPYWMAPEVIACEQQLDYNYDVRCDIWSLGVTAIELADGEPPLSNVHPMRALFQIPRNPPPTLTRQGEWSNEFNDFISECLAKDFEERPSATELLEHPFLKDVSIISHVVRDELVQLDESLKQKKENVQKRPEMTIKGGALKPDRKTKRTPLWMDDLATLEKLSEEIIVEHLKRRYELNCIYTYIGDILIAVNPFKELPIYGEKESERHRGLVKSESVPHIFAMADSAYHAMLHQKLAQCIVISGESGAGKTESANFLLKHLVSLGMAPNGSLEDKILLINPIMEAFGNAQTGINDNSSRFGKYLELNFTKLGRVTGAKISVYLLEQSRVVYQAEGEQNFHIFYYLYDWMEADEKLSQYYLEGSRRGKHKYLSGPSWNKAMSENHVKKFRKVVEGFTCLGFDENDVHTIYQILSAIINLGDVDFYQTIDKDNIEQAALKNVDQIKIVSELLSIDASQVTEAMTSNCVVTKGETISRNNTVEEALTARDSMAKALYGRLFDWIVNKINRLLSLGKTFSAEGYSIGVLDIFGFENFPQNSFEQLCINIANEQIQYFFNQHIFTWEQQEYISEGVDVEIIKFSDNRPVLDMFLSKPVGLLSLLDEESRFPQANDLSLVEKFHSNINSKHYIKPKGQGSEFTVRHFAGKVTYTAKGFLKKNKNFLCNEIIHIFRGSSSEIVRFMFQCPLTKTGNLHGDTSKVNVKSSVEISVSDELNSKSSSSSYESRGLASQTKAQQTVGTYFRYSLMDLLQKMVNGKPHFIRCVKPNDTKSKDHFDDGKVERQLRCTGVMETVRIRQHGFSHRIPFAEFLRRYCFLAFSFDERVVASRATCRLLLVRLKMDGWAIGKSKVFLKYYHVEYLTKLYEREIKKIIKVQACIRRWLAKIRKNREGWNVASTALQLQSHVQDFVVREKVKSIVPRGSSIDADSKSDSKDRTSNDRMEIDEDFRGYKTRCEYGPVLEKKLKKLVEEHVDNMDEAAKALENEGLSHGEAELVIENFWGRFQKRKSDAASTITTSEDEELNPKYVNDFEEFTEKVHLSNENVHLVLRQNQGYIRLREVTDPPVTYTRPKGFDRIPQIIHEQRKKGSEKQVFYRPRMSFKPPNNAATTYYDMLQQDHRREHQRSPSPTSRRNTLGDPIKEMLLAVTPSPPSHPVNSVSHTSTSSSQLEVPGRPSAAGVRREKSNENTPGVPRMTNNAPPINPQRHYYKVTHQQEEVEAGGDLEGPFQFQKLLRKTNFAPTDSLRRRREEPQRMMQ